MSFFWSFSSFLESSVFFIFLFLLFSSFFWVLLVGFVILMSICFDVLQAITKKLVVIIIAVVPNIFSNFFINLSPNYFFI
ncbi:hypothetical protein FOY66_01695 [Mycoplasma capricolum subsp. capripneumoniae]|nr:hypothetical protein DQW15_01710 [Mycoplasma capricolum subsp. capripneumoniae]QDL20628.1 hypothetical protein DQW16_01710 [Mycoplasma capricolum subsp. capripneumoniae]QDL21313.1 hypothetical protein DQW17_01710 [Mycoplasma capricolum subsp. capripneumoniae]QIF40579.1 hypothetical protein MCCP002_01695 [Mycoplasma capricolum subsp. capripneumoniae]QIN42719.1 hypothetical protein FOY62_01690 [Mycoplasma capricolum subsp. capripneumoniae]